MLKGIKDNKKKKIDELPINVKYTHHNIHYGIICIHCSTEILELLKLSPIIFNNGDDGGGSRVEQIIILHWIKTTVRRSRCINK